MEMQHWCLPLLKMGKMAVAPKKTHPRAKLPITNSPKDLISSFSSVNENGKLVSVIMENGENDCSSPKTCPRAKLPDYQPT